MVYYDIAEMHYKAIILSMAKRNPRYGNTEGFLFVKVSYSQAVTVLISVQPFADIVASYTCQDRDNKGYYNIYDYHLLSAGGTRLYHINTCSNFRQIIINNRNLSSGKT